MGTLKRFLHIRSLSPHQPPLLVIITTDLSDLPAHNCDNNGCTRKNESVDKVPGRLCSVGTSLFQSAAQAPVYSSLMFYLRTMPITHSPGPQSSVGFFALGHM